MALLDLQRIEAPAPLLGIEAIKDHVVVDHDEHDILLLRQSAVAVRHLDGYSGILGRALVEQTWRLWLPCAPRGAVALPLPPLIDVDEILYVDPEGVDQILPDDQYVVIDGEQARVEPAYGCSWPSMRRQSRAMSITFRCGYGAPGDVPEDLQQAVLLMIADQYKNRESGVEGTISSDLVGSVDFKSLISPYRIRRI